MPGIMTMTFEAGDWPVMGPDQAGDRPPSINATTTITLPRMSGTVLIMARCYMPRAPRSRQNAPSEEGAPHDWVLTSAYSAQSQLGAAASAVQAHSGPQPQLGPHWQVAVPHVQLEPHWQGLQAHSLFIGVLQGSGFRMAPLYPPPARRT